MTAKEQKTLETEIAKINKKMPRVQGTPCEVYSRVVGYLRPVQGWNKGKQEEFALRRNMKVEGAKCPCEVC